MNGSLLNFVTRVTTREWSRSHLTPELYPRATEQRRRKMKLKDFKNLKPNDTVILWNGRECQVVAISRGMSERFWAELFYTDTLRKVFKTPRQIRGKV